MVRYSLSPSEHEIKRGIRQIQREIKQGIFVDIPMDYESVFDEEFYVKLANVKELSDEQYEFNGNEVELENAELNSHTYGDGNTLFYLSNTELKDILEKFSYKLANDLRMIILAVLPTSVRQTSIDDYISTQHKFF